MRATKRALLASVQEFGRDECLDFFLRRWLASGANLGLAWHQQRYSEWRDGLVCGHSAACVPARQDWRLARTAGSVAGTAAQVAGQAAGAASDRLRTIQHCRQRHRSVQVLLLGQPRRLHHTADQVTPSRVEDAANTGSGRLGALPSRLMAAAAIAGGYVGARPQGHDSPDNG